MNGTTLELIDEQDARRDAGDDWSFTEMPNAIVAVRIVRPWSPPAARDGGMQKFRTWGEVAGFMAQWRAEDSERRARAVLMGAAS